MQGEDGHQKPRKGGRYSTQKEPTLWTCVDICKKEQHGGGDIVILLSFTLPTPNLPSRSNVTRCQMGRFTRGTFMKCT